MAMRRRGKKCILPHISSGVDEVKIHPSVQVRGLGIRVLALVLFGSALISMSPHGYSRNKAEVRNAQIESVVSNALMQKMENLKMHRRLENQKIFHKEKKDLSKISDVLLTEKEDKDLEIDNLTRYHTVFSTDCYSHMYWRNYMVFYTALKVRQPGHVTQIVSGCNEKEAENIMNWFYKNVAVLSERFHIQLTPHFSTVSNGEVHEYRKFSKAFGLKYWMEHSPNLERKTHANTSPIFDRKHDHDIVISIEPEMVFTRPIKIDPKIIVKKGSLVVQSYDNGSQWESLDLDRISIDELSPAGSYDQSEKSKYFAMGPPYIIDLGDMHEISKKWSEYVHRVYKETADFLMADRYSFSIAVAESKLKPTLIDSLMVSNPKSSKENWDMIDEIPDNKVCGFGKNPDQSVDHTPNVLYLSNQYSIGTEWFYSEHIISPQVYDCNRALFQEPPNSIPLFYDYRWPPSEQNKTVVPKSQIKRESFILCSATALLNEAATMFKSTACKKTNKIQPNMLKTKKIVDFFPFEIRHKQKLTAKANERKENQIGKKDKYTNLGEPKRHKEGENYDKTKG